MVPGQRQAWGYFNAAIDNLQDYTQVFGPLPPPKRGAESVHGAYQALTWHLHMGVIAVETGQQPMHLRIFEQHLPLRPLSKCKSIRPLKRTHHWILIAPKHNSHPPSLAQAPFLSLKIDN